jgi:hypothetical protein
MVFPPFPKKIPKNPPEICKVIRYPLYLLLVTVVLYQKGLLIMKGLNEVSITSLISFFDDGTTVPDLLTEQEAIRYLRLDTNGPKHPEITLQHYRQEGLLRPTRVGKHLRYTKSELLRFLEEQTERTNENIS